MSDDPSLDDDLARAKEIIDRGRVTPQMTKALRPNQALIDAIKNGGTIYGADIYAAYKLLESFVAEIDRLRACPVFRPDHNGECGNCDERIDAHTPAAIEAGRAH